MNATYTEPGREDGDGLTGYVTEPVISTTPFGEAIYVLLGKEAPMLRMGQTVLITVQECWSGYSEYSITSTWSEVYLTIPELDWERNWPSMGHFLRALSDANPEEDH